MGPSPRASNKQGQHQKGRKGHEGRGTSPTEAKKTSAKKKSSELQRAVSSSIYLSSPRTQCRFPTSRIWRLVRNSDDVSVIRTTADAVFLINLASELFLEKFAQEAFSAAGKKRKSSITYSNLSSIVSSKKRFEFLSDVVPEKVRASDALKTGG